MARSAISRITIQSSLPDEEQEHSSASQVAAEVAERDRARMAQFKRDRREYAERRQAAGGGRGSGDSTSCPTAEKKDPTPVNKDTQPALAEWAQLVMQLAFAAVLPQASPAPISHPPADAPAEAPAMRSVDFESPSRYDQHRADQEWLARGLLTHAHDKNKTPSPEVEEDGGGATSGDDKDKMPSPEVQEEGADGDSGDGVQEMGPEGASTPKTPVHDLTVETPLDTETPRRRSVMTR